jgi:hypothetical protein
MGLDVVVHACNSSYSGGRGRKIMVGGQPGKSEQDPSSKTSWAWWFAYVIPATREPEIGGLQFKASPGKSMRPYLITN